VSKQTSKRNYRSQEGTRNLGKNLQTDVTSLEFKPRRGKNRKKNNKVKIDYNRPNTAVEGREVYCGGPAKHKRGQEKDYYQYECGEGNPHANEEEARNLMVEETGIQHTLKRRTERIWRRKENKTEADTTTNATSPNNNIENEANMKGTKRGAQKLKTGLSSNVAMEKQRQGQETRP